MMGICLFWVRLESALSYLDGYVMDEGFYDVFIWNSWEM